MAPQPSTMAELRKMEEILSMQSLRLEKEIKQIKEGGRGRCGQIFKIPSFVVNWTLLEVKERGEGFHDKWIDGMTG